MDGVDEAGVKGVDEKKNGVDKERRVGENDWLIDDWSVEISSFTGINPIVVHI